MKWHKIKLNLSYLPLFLIWEVWKERNASIFNNLKKNNDIIYLKFVSSFMDCNKLEVCSKRNICTFPSLVHEHPVGFFDGTTMKGACGARIVLKVGNVMAVNGWTKQELELI